jgi:hypothetical protein
MESLIIILVDHLFIAAGLCIISGLLLTPVLYSRHNRYYPHPNFALAAFLAFVASLFALLFMAALVGVAITRFNRAGIDTRLGPSVCTQFITLVVASIELAPEMQVWMAVAGVLVLTILATSSGCGNMCRGRYGRTSPFVSYNV